MAVHTSCIPRVCHVHLGPLLRLLRSSHRLHPHLSYGCSSHCLQFLNSLCCRAVVSQSLPRPLSSLRLLLSPPLTIFTFLVRNTLMCCLIVCCCGACATVSSLCFTLCFLHLSPPLSAYLLWKTLPLLFCVADALELLSAYLFRFIYSMPHQPHTPPFVCLTSH